MACISASRLFDPLADICPRKLITLDTHDGIGLVDAEGLLTGDEIDATQEIVDALTADIRPYLPFPSVVRVPGKPGAAISNDDDLLLRSGLR